MNGRIITYLLIGIIAITSVYIVTVKVDLFPTGEYIAIDMDISIWREAIGDTEYAKLESITIYGSEKTTLFWAWPWESTNDLNLLGSISFDDTTFQIDENFGPSSLYSSAPETVTIVTDIPFTSDYLAIGTVISWDFQILESNGAWINPVWSMMTEYHESWSGSDIVS